MAKRWQPPMLPDPRVLAVHRLAMAAKEAVFKAQDAEGRVDSPHHDHPLAALSVKLRRRLAKVRAELEALDRDVRHAMEVRAPLGSAEKDEGFYAATLVVVPRTPCRICGEVCASQDEFTDENEGRRWDTCSGCMEDELAAAAEWEADNG